MPAGTVTARAEAVLPLRVRAPAGTVRDVTALIDTGYTGTLALPLALVVQLGLTRSRPIFVRLADGSTRLVQMYDAEVEWDGSWRAVAVSAVGRRPILGMELLVRTRVTIDVTPGGVVEIAPLP